MTLKIPRMFTSRGLSTIRYSDQNIEDLDRTIPKFDKLRFEIFQKTISWFTDLMNSSWRHLCIILTVFEWKVLLSSVCFDKSIGSPEIMH